MGTLDACGICNGPGAIYACGCTSLDVGACDCFGNVLDALGVCGGDCMADADGDGVCDDVDTCVGALMPAASAMARRGLRLWVFRNSCGRLRLQRIPT